MNQPIIEDLLFLLLGKLYKKRCSVLTHPDFEGHFGVKKRVLYTGKYGIPFHINRICDLHSRNTL